MTADVENNIFMIGYSFGIFYPAYNGIHRWLKTGLGLGAFYSTIKIDYNFFSKYELIGNEECEISGECFGKSKIDQLDSQIYDPLLVLNFTLWERKKEDSIWIILGR